MKPRVWLGKKIGNQISNLPRTFVSTYIRGSTCVHNQSHDHQDSAAGPEQPTPRRDSLRKLRKCAHRRELTSGRNQKLPGPVSNGYHERNPILWPLSQLFPRAHGSAAQHLTHTAPFGIGGIRPAFWPTRDVDRTRRCGACSRAKV